MPKGKLYKHKSRPITIRTKAKIGGRKSNIGALQLSIEALQKIVESTGGRPRDKQLVRSVLQGRLAQR